MKIGFQVKDFYMLSIRGDLCFSLLFSNWNWRIRPHSRFTRCNNSRIYTKWDPKSIRDSRPLRSHFPGSPLRYEKKKVFAFWELGRRRRRSWFSQLNMKMLFEFGDEEVIFLKENWEVIFQKIRCILFQKIRCIWFGVNRL